MALSSDLTPAKIRKEGWDALISKLGATNSLRFLLEYEKGRGNYTELRRELFAGQTVGKVKDFLTSRPALIGLSGGKRDR